MAPESLVVNEADWMVKEILVKSGDQVQVNDTIMIVHSGVSAFDAYEVDKAVSSGLDSNVLLQEYFKPKAITSSHEGIWVFTYQPQISETLAKSSVIGGVLVNNMTDLNVQLTGQVSLLPEKDKLVLTDFSGEEVEVEVVNADLGLNGSQSIRMRLPAFRHSLLENKVCRLSLSPESLFNLYFREALFR